MQKLKNSREKKWIYLLLSIGLDALGYVSYLIPALGDFSDLIWAPVSAIILFMMYPRKYGFTGGVVQFIEEAFPGTDFIPSFTLTWFWFFVLLPPSSSK